MILACDNQTSEFYKVQGYGAMLDLDIVAVDGKEVDFKANPFETIFFDRIVMNCLRKLVALRHTMES